MYCRNEQYKSFLCKARNLLNSLENTKTTIISKSATVTARVPWASHKWASTRENLSLGGGGGGGGVANNTSADQPAHPRSLISAFVVRFFESSTC